jgi:tetratricopeptide (TPR) repeat protein
MTLTAANNLAEALLQARQFDRAAALFREVLAAHSPQAPRDDAARIRTQGALGLCLLLTDRFAEAEPLLRESLEHGKRHAPDAWTTFDVQSQLGGCLLGQKKYADAKPLLLAGYEGLKERAQRIPAHRQARLTDALRRLVHLYEATGDRDRAAAYREQLERPKRPGP